MLQCQHAWPQAILFAVMEGGMDWTMHGLELLCCIVFVCLFVYVCVCLKKNIRCARFCCSA